MTTPAELLAQSLAALRNANRIDGTRASYRKDNPTEYAAVLAYLDDGTRPGGNLTLMGKGLVLAEDARQLLTVAPSPYTYRFATFDPTIDRIDGCLNRFDNPDNSYWWVPGTPEGPAWAKGGGIFPLTHPTYGPGFSLVCDPQMTYQGAGDSRVVRFQIDPDKPSIFPTPIPIAGATHDWEWTWMRPGNQQPWPQGVYLEGMYFGTTVSGQASVGAHLYLDNNWQKPGPFHYYVARQSAHNTWERFHCPIAFDQDEYHAIRWRTKWSTGADGRMEAWTSVDGQPSEKWCDYSGPTLPFGFQGVYSIGQDIRLPLVGSTQTLHWLNHRLTLA
jgi:hypothetical protein